MQILDKKAIIQRLKSWREANKLTSRKFALNAGVDPAHYFKVEGGKMLITENMLVKFFGKYSTLNRNYILYGTENIPGIQAADINDDETVLPLQAEGETAVNLAEKIIQLAPAVHPAMTAAELYQQFTIRESKYRLAFSLLKQTVAEMEADIKQLRAQLGK